MFYGLRLLLMVLLLVKQEADLAGTVRKFVYQKDMSEYCRRRVLPSVFLGRHVVGAYSQILHFSRLELPYSCFVSIRTESGSNIILVIQLMSDKNLIESCRENKNQLLVYEIGETFGGYWGALPDIVINPEPPSTSHENQYVLKTTQSMTTSTTSISTIQENTTLYTAETLENTFTKSTNPVDDIVVEVPLVNVSAILVPSDLSGETLFDFKESFDTMVDVEPKPGVSYKTTVLPLVQFAMSNEVNEWHPSGPGTHGAFRYEVDLNGDLFTPDPRLSYPLLRLSTRSKQRGKYKYNANSRLDFKKNKKLSAQKALVHKISQAQPKPLFDSQPRDFYTRLDFTRTLPQKETKHDHNPFEVVDAILRNLSKTKEEDPKTNLEIDEDVANLLQGLAKIKTNESVFLVPNASWFTRRSVSTTQPSSTRYSTDKLTWRQPSASYRTNYLEDFEDTSNTEGVTQDYNKSSNTITLMNNNDSVIIDRTSGPLLPLALDVDHVINVTTQNNMRKMDESLIVNPDTLASEVSGTTTTAAATPETIKPMTLVDHESWDNMVQAASLMAVMLNQSVTASVDDKQRINATQTLSSKMRRRKKRYIHAIPIEHAKPHHLLANMEQYPSSNVYSDKIYDSQEFQRLIELQDDEVHDRVALRYLRQYVGPVLFNICDFKEAAAKHVYLFNSSRLVLAITNFTLERMTVVMTPARTLLSSDSRCAPAHLECQVSGARVCIDSLSACDGVPNCGSYDIYDEDRLQCGGSAGLQHNVYLAAITFLAVLLTILYTVHYWLKRCVPKVSDAFFIYTDAAENVLYLDPIMRSPHDTEDAKLFFRNAALQDYMECTGIEIQKKTVSSFFSRLSRLFRCKRKKKISSVLDIEEEYDAIDPISRRYFSFAEAEINKMGTPFVNDVAVQTGESLEMQVKDNTIRNNHSDYADVEAHNEGMRRSSGMRSTLSSEMLRNEPSDVLNIINFFRKARSVSMQISSSHDGNNSEMETWHLPALTKEKEIQCLEYDYSIISPLTESDMANTGQKSDKKPEHGLIEKKLRFVEELTTIEVSDDDELEEEVVLDPVLRRSVVYGGGKNVHTEDTDSNTDMAEPSTSTNREFKSYFWGSGKNKPKKSTKKKTQHSLR